MDSLILTCPLCCNQNVNSIEALREHLVYFVYRPITCPVCRVPVIGLQRLVHHLEIHVGEGFSFDSHEDVGPPKKECELSLAGKEDVSPDVHEYNLTSAKDPFLAETATRITEPGRKMGEKSSSTYSIVDSLINSEKNTLEQLDLFSIQKEFSDSDSTESCNSAKCCNKSESVSDKQSDSIENRNPNHSIVEHKKCTHVPVSNVPPGPTSSNIENSIVASTSIELYSSMGYNPNSVQLENCNNITANAENGWSLGSCSDTRSTTSSPSTVSTHYVVTETVGPAHELQPPMAWSACSGKTQKKSPLLSPMDNFPSKNIVQHHRPSMQAYVCQNCGAKIVGQDSYFSHLQEHTDEMRKFSNGNERSSKSDSNEFSSTANKISGLINDGVQPYCSNENHSLAHFSSNELCQIEADVPRCRSVPKQPNCGLMTPLTGEYQNIESIEPLRKSSGNLPSITSYEVSVDMRIIEDGPTILANESSSNGLVNCISKPSRIADSDTPLIHEKTPQNETEKSGIDSSVGSISEFEYSLVDEKSCQGYDIETSFSGKKRELLGNDGTCKTNVQPSLCDKLDDHNDTNTETLSNGREKKEITTMVKKPYLHKKFHHEQKSTILCNTDRDKNGVLKDVEKRGCYIPDIQSVWISRLNESVDRDEPQVSQDVRQLEKLRETEPTTEETSSSTLMILEKSRSNDYSTYKHFNVEVLSGATTSEHLRSRCPEFEKLRGPGHEFLSSQTIAVNENESSSWEGAINDHLLQQNYFTGRHENRNHNQSFTTGEASTSCVETSSIEQVDVLLPEPPYDCSVISCWENYPSLTTVSTKSSSYNTSEQKAKFVLSSSNIEVLGRQKSETVSHQERPFALPSTCTVTQCEISPSSQVGIFTSAKLMKPHCAVPKSLTRTKESSHCGRILTNSLKSDKASSADGEIEHGNSHSAIGSIETFRCHAETGDETSELHEVHNDMAHSLKDNDDDNDNILGILRSATAVVNGVQDERQDSIPEEPTGSSLPLSSASSDSTTQGLSNESRNTDENRPKLHECRECGKTFQNLSNHRRHLREVHNHSKKYLCSVCSKSFSSLRQLINHKGVHESQKKFQCNICGHQCYTAAGIRSHKYQEHQKQKNSSKAFRCNLCNESFARNFGLQRHFRRRHGEKLFPCPHCDKSYTSLADLQNHSASHTDQNGNLPHVCTFCESQFKSRFALKRHSAIRHSFPPSNGPEKTSYHVNCSVQSEGVLEKSNELSNFSSRYNDNDSGRHCDLLHRKSSVATELSLTTRETVLNCDTVDSNEARVCQKQRNFADNSSQIIPRKSSMSQNCLENDSSFQSSIGASVPSGSTSFSVQNGMGAFKPGTSSNSKVSFEDKRESSAGARLKPDRTGKFICPVCSQSCTRKDTLKVHLRSHSSERPFKCDKCDLTFKRRSVLLTHQDKHAPVSKYLCSLCNKRFRFKMSLKHHSCVLKPDNPSSSPNN